MMHCLKLKKTEKNAKPYFDHMFGKLSFEQKQAKALELNLIAAPTTAEPEPEPDTNDPRPEMLRSINAIACDLEALNIKTLDIENIVNAMAKGTKLAECTAETLTAIEERLFVMRQKEQVAKVEQDEIPF